ncbi:MAG: hypothetical protein AAB875_03700 [Patescibacteria group bacterium]
MKKEPKTIIGYKGFDKDFKCRDFQFEVGKEYTHDGDVKLCNSGFHFYEHPLDVFDYYNPNESRFAEVEGTDVSDEKESDTKRVSKTIKINGELTIAGLVQAAIKFTFDNAKWLKKSEVSGEREAAKITGDRGAASATGYSGAASATGDRGAASATGDRGAASATGDSGAASATGYNGAASATGYRGAASATGYEGCAVALGWEGRALGKIGCWLTIAEWKQDKDNNWHRADVQTKIVDGKKIREDVFYVLKNGKFVAV